MSERSQSRGRNTDVYIASGRGGAGNIRSVSRDAVKANPAEYDDDAGVPRGREIDVSHKVLSSGRGGAGNIRDPSKDRNLSPSSGLDAREREIIAKRIAQEQEDGVHSSGRGGAGNIRSNSRSRSRPPTDVSPAPVYHSTGRGGAGNMATQLSGEAAHLAAVLESEIASAKYLDAEPKLHSTGRGGAANFTSAPIPRDSFDAGAPRSSSRGPISSGRGGAGNIHASSEDTGSERGREPHKGFIGSTIDAVRTSISRSRASKDEPR